MKNKWCLMEEFTPPINARENDELIIIAGSSTADWRQEAIDQAKAELRKRGISAEQQTERFNEIRKAEEEAWQEELEFRRTLDYFWYQKIIIAFLWFYVIFTGWNLRKDGYILRAKRKWQLIVLGIGVYGIMISWSNRDWKIQEQKRIDEIEKVDISTWEKKRLPYDTINAKQTIVNDTNSNKLKNDKPN